MPKVIRKGVDPSAGYGQTLISGSPDVKTNKLDTARDQDPYPLGSAIGLAKQVYANKRLVHRAGDPITTPDTAANGSPNVFAG